MAAKPSELLADILFGLFVLAGVVAYVGNAPSGPVYGYFVGISLGFLAHIITEIYEFHLSVSTEVDVDGGRKQ